MATPILATKLYVPPPRPKVVLRPHLIDRLNEGLATGRKLTLISAAAGFGKTTLVSEWIAASGRPVTWLSLDENDKDANNFLIYLTSALQKVSSNVGRRKGLNARFQLADVLYLTSIGLIAGASSISAIPKVRATRS